MNDITHSLVKFDASTGDSVEDFFVSNIDMMTKARFSEISQWTSIIDISKNI